MAHFIGKFLTTWSLNLKLKGKILSDLLDTQFSLKLGNLSIIRFSLVTFFQVFTEILVYSDLVKIKV